VIRCGAARDTSLRIVCRLTIFGVANVPVWRPAPAKVTAGRWTGYRSTTPNSPDLRRRAAKKSRRSSNTGGATGLGLEHRQRLREQPRGASSGQGHCHQPCTSLWRRTADGASRFRGECRDVARSSRENQDIVDTPLPPDEFLNAYFVVDLDSLPARLATLGNVPLKCCVVFFFWVLFCILPWSIGHGDNAEDGRGLAQRSACQTACRCLCARGGRQDRAIRVGARTGVSRRSEVVTLVMGAGGPGRALTSEEEKCLRLHQAVLKTNSSTEPRIVS